MYSYLLLLWPQLVAETGNGDGALLQALEAQFHKQRPRLVAELRDLLRSTSTAESFACEASWVLAP